MAKEKTLTEIVPQFLATKQQSKWVKKHPRKGDALRRLIDNAIETKTSFVKDQLK